MRAWNNSQRRKILAIDPGLRATGAALLENGTLSDCVLARSTDSGTGEPDIYGAHEVAAVTCAYVENLAKTRGPFDLVVIEWPRVRPIPGGQARRRENPNDLLPLALVHGFILERLFERGVTKNTRIAPIPADLWTRGVPKEARHAQFFSRPADHPDGGLNEVERRRIDAIKPASLRHNTVDAVALGKWASYAPRFGSLIEKATPRRPRLD